MTRGFTLLELLITVVVLSVLLAAAAPSFSSLLASSKLQRLAPEVHGFLVTARSEAIARNQELHLLFLVSNVLGAIEDSEGEWDLVVSTTASYVPDNVVMHLDGSAYRDIKVSFSFLNQNSLALFFSRNHLSNVEVLRLKQIHPFFDRLKHRISVYT